LYYIKKKKEKNCLRKISRLEVRKRKLEAGSIIAKVIPGLGKRSKIAEKRGGEGESE